MDPVRELKIRADVLLGRIARGEADALARLATLKNVAAADAQKKHCLAIVARAAGFTNWEHAVRVLASEGDDASDDDVGTMLYAGPGMLNEWFASYDEARARLDEATERHYLLGYKRHFLVVTATFVDALGMNPDDPDWAAIGWDWARPRERAARSRLYFQRLDAMRRAQ